MCLCALSGALNGVDQPAPALLAPSEIRIELVIFSSIMASDSAIRGRLVRISRSIRVVLRCLGGVKESQEGYQRALLLLCELLDLLCRLQDQLTWAEEKWIVDSSRLRNLDEVLRSLESTIEAIDVYFQPGGVSARLYRKRLLDKTFIPRLEQFKVMIILSMQPESKEKCCVEEKVRLRIRQFQELDADSIRASTPKCEDFHHITSQMTTKGFMRLADLCNHRQKGTCEWIFDNEKYTDWIFGTRRNLYCVGPAGAGKTVLASTIIDNLQKTFTSSDVAIVFIFGHDETEEPANSIGFLDKILAQLVYRKRTPSHATATLYRSKAFEEGRASAKSFQDAIRAEVNRFSKVFFVIDGIDQQSEKDRILNRLQKLPDHAQLLVTMREEKVASKEDHLSVMADREDLELYVASRIEQDEGMRALLREYPSELRVAIAQQVAQKSHGLFLLARLHVDLLSRCTDGNLLQRALFHLPENLNDTYGESMTRIVSHNLYASRCLYWTLYACRPLTVSELNFAANFEPLGGIFAKDSSSSEHAILHEAAGLLTIDPMTGTVHLVHKTAIEYLGGPAARVFFPSAKKHIADTCLTIITSDEVVDQCYVTNGKAPRKPRGGLLDYATMYWGHHARDVGEDEQTTQVLIRAFLNKLCWRRPPVEGSHSNGSEIPKHLGFGGYFSDWSALHVLAFYGIIGKAKRLIEQGANINDHDNQLGMTPLHCAVNRGNEEMIEFLLEHNVDLNAVCKQGNTALHMAAEQGHRKIIRTLLHRRINSRTSNQYGATALQLAVGTAYDEAVVPLLIKNRFDMDVQNTITGNTALHLAVELKRPRIISFLVEKGANMSVLNRQGITPLQLACKHDNCEAVSLLLERSPNLEDRSSHGDTALHIAAMEGNWVALDLLSIGGADINAWDSKGESLLHQQARKGCTVSIASHLLEQGANIEACNSQGYTPLQCAAITGNKVMLKLLVDRGANIDVETAKGETLLHITPSSNQVYLDILTLLLELNLSANATTCGGMTPLHHLIVNQMGYCDPSSDKTTDYISLLLSHGANINAQVRSPKAETALHLAVAAKIPRESLVAFLVKNGASLDAKRADGKTPLHLAAERGRRGIFRDLLGSGADTSIKAPSDASSNPGSISDGDTALELAQRHPVSVLWFEDAGKLNNYTPDTGRGSIATSIEEIGFSSEFDEIGSTLVGEDGSTWGSRASTSSMKISPIVSL